MKKKPTILLSNDDGVLAPGLKILAQYLRKIATVVVVAPTEERSTAGHCLTIHKPLRIHEIEDGFYGVTGSPADCVYVGIREILKKNPDLVVSGPNRGANLGQDVYYSGTVSAAREACILGLPAIAISVDIVHGKSRTQVKKVHYETAGDFMVKFLKSWDYNAIPKYSLLNVNVPNIPANKVKGTQVVRQGFRYYSGDIIKRIDHRRRPYFWIGGEYRGFHNKEGTDCVAVAKGHVSITPLQLDCTNYEFLNQMGSVQNVGGKLK